MRIIIFLILLLGNSVTGVLFDESQYMRTPMKSFGIENDNLNSNSFEAQTVKTALWKTDSRVTIKPQGSIKNEAIEFSLCYEIQNLQVSMIISGISSNLPKVILKKFGEDQSVVILDQIGPTNYSEIDVTFDDRGPSIPQSSNSSILKGIYRPMERLSSYKNMTVCRWTIDVFNTGNTTLTFSFAAINLQYYAPVFSQFNGYYNPGSSGMFQSKTYTAYSDQRISDLETISIPMRIPNDTIKIKNMLVEITLSHTYTRELVMKLYHPSGAYITLYKQDLEKKLRIKDMRNTLFDDNAVSFGLESYDQATIKPYERLSYFKGSMIAGVWKLTITDMARNDIGTFNNFKLIFNTIESDGVDLSYAYRINPDFEISYQSSSIFEINITDPVIINSINAKLSLKYSGIGNLRIDLIHPDNTSISLINRRGGDAINLENYYFDDFGYESISNFSETFYSRYYRPESPFNTFQGKMLNGTWKVNITNFGDSDNGTFYYFELYATKFYKMLSPASIPIMTEISFDSSISPTSLTDMDTTKVQFVIPLNHTIISAKSLVSITHPYISDLQINLLHPDKTKVKLFNRGGRGGDNMVDTVFDENSAVFIKDGSAPFRGSFRPESSLAQIGNKTSVGSWSLEINDLKNSDSGTLLKWTLSFNISRSLVSKIGYDSQGSYGILLNLISEGQSISQTLALKSSPNLYWEFWGYSLCYTKDSFILTWTNKSSTAFEIYFQRFNISGIALGPKIEVQMPENTSNVNPSCAIVNNGKAFALIWQRSKQDGTSLDIYGKMFDLNGSALNEEFNVTEAGIEGNRINPSVISLDVGNIFVVSWIKYFPFGRNSLYLRFFNSNGVAINSEILIHEDDSRTIESAALTNLENNYSFIISWIKTGNVLSKIYYIKACLDKSDFYDITLDRCTAGCSSVIPSIGEYKYCESSTTNGIDIGRLLGAIFGLLGVVVAIIIGCKICKKRRESPPPPRYEQAPAVYSPKVAPYIPQQTTVILTKTTTTTEQVVLIKT